MKLEIKHLLIILTAIIFVAMANGQNLIPNGGFDDGPDWSCCMIFPAPMDSACNIIDTVYLAGPDYWYSYGDASIRFVYGNPVIECYDNTTPPSMPSWININEYERVGVNLIESLIPGNKYKLSYYVKIDSVSAAWFPYYGQKDTWAYFVFNNGGNIIKSQTFTVQNNLHYWIQYDTTFIATANSDTFEIWGVDTILTVILFDNFELNDIGVNIDKQSDNLNKTPEIQISENIISINIYDNVKNIISVYNIQGQSIYSSTINSNQKYIIDTRSFKNGIYLITIQSDNQIYSEKIIINH